MQLALLQTYTPFQFMCHHFSRLGTISNNQSCKYMNIKYHSNNSRQAITSESLLTTDEDGEVACTDPLSVISPVDTGGGEEEEEESEEVVEEREDGGDGEGWEALRGCAGLVD